jgi:DegV family protein with EDD domain
LKKVDVVTDSSACLPPALADELGIRIVPIPVHLPSGEVHDGDPGASEEVYAAIESGEAVKSEAPSAADYLAAIESTTSASIVVVTPAVEFTVMHRNAWLAAQMAERRVVVIDCRTAAAAHGLVVIHAARAAASGSSFEEVKSVIEAGSSRAELCAKLDALESIEQSGRVPSTTLEGARRMRVRPVFRLHLGTVEPLGLQQSNGAALRRISREFESRGGKGSEAVAVFHAARPDEAGELSAAVSGDPMILEFSPSMGIHTGSGVVGVAWLKR